MSCMVGLANLHWGDINGCKGPFHIPQEELLVCGKQQQPLQEEMQQGPWSEGNPSSDCNNLDFPLHLIAKGPLDTTHVFLWWLWGKIPLCVVKGRKGRRKSLLLFQGTVREMACFISFWDLCLNLESVSTLPSDSGGEGRLFQLPLWVIAGCLMWRCLMQLVLRMCSLLLAWRSVLFYSFPFLSQGIWLFPKWPPFFFTMKPLPLFMKDFIFLKFIFFMQ